MRIIGGHCKGRRLLAPGRRFADRVRPTSDRAREGVFNIVRDWVEGAAVLDLFAGTGALGLEALSRGAASVLFVEQDPEVGEMLARNLELCGFTAPVARTLRRDCSGSLDFLRNLAPSGGFTLVLADPPYGRGLAARVLRELAALIPAERESPTGSGAGARLPVLAPEALIILETGRSERLPVTAGVLRAVKEQRRYGEALFHFYQPEGEGRSSR